MSLITLENEYVKAVVNTHAGYVESLVSKKDGKEHSWQYDSSVWPRRTAVCFPLCGKCKDDKYTFSGKTYDLPNHGFLRERDLKTEKQSTSSLVLSDEWDASTLSRYPFRYRYEIEYVLEGEKVNIYYHVTNLDRDEMYYSTGSHYTYALPVNQRDAYLFFEKKESAGAFSQADGLLHEDELKNRSMVPLKGLIDSSSFILDLNTLSSSWVGLGDKTGPFTRVSGNGFRYLIVWAPAGGTNDFTCIEFWDGMGHVETASSELDRKFAVRSLAPGEARTYLQTVYLA